MSDPFLQPILDALGARFGPLDNTVEKWEALGPDLLAFVPQVSAALEAHFPAGSAPRSIFQAGESTFRGLSLQVAGSGQPVEIIRTATGYLNLRFYIYLNGFLSACQESLQKVAFNDALDAAELVEKSYYKPFFFERVAFTQAEMTAMLAEDLTKLSDAPEGQKGILLALRIRKGIVSTLTESYCPAHPLLYPAVKQLDEIKTQNSPAMIEEITAALETLLKAIQEENH